MTIDDTTAIACIGALVTAVVILWKLNDVRQKAGEKLCRGELAKRDEEIKDCVKRIRKLEDERVPVYQTHAAELKQMSESMRATTDQVAKSLDAVARTLADIARNGTPSPTPAQPETDAVVRIGRQHG